jgi:hypothetical protein
MIADSANRPQRSIAKGGLLYDNKDVELWRFGV